MSRVFVGNAAFSRVGSVTKNRTILPQPPDAFRKTLPFPTAQPPVPPLLLSSTGLPPCGFRTTRSGNRSRAAPSRSVPGNPSASPCRRSAPAESAARASAGCARLEMRCGVPYSGSVRRLQKRAQTSRLTDWTQARIFGRLSPGSRPWTCTGALTECTSRFQRTDSSRYKRDMSQITPWK